MPRPKKIKLSLLNGHLLCGLCGGYLIDATVLTNCIHAFCRSCILKYLSEFNKLCPLCQTLSQEGRSPKVASGVVALRPDVTLQRVVYKLVPGLLRVEIERIAEFHSHYTNNPSKVAREVRWACRLSRARHDANSGERRGSGLSSPTPTPLATRSCSVSYPTRGTAVSPSSFTSLESFPPATSIACLIDITDIVSLSLEALPSDLTSGLIQSSPTVYLLCPALCTVAHLQRLLLAKHEDSLINDQQYNFGCIVADIFLGCEYLEPSHSLRELAFLYAWPTQRRVLPLLYRFSDVRAPWWGYPMPRLDPEHLLPSPTESPLFPSASSSSPSPVKQQRIHRTNKS